MPTTEQKSATKKSLYFRLAGESRTLTRSFRPALSFWSAAADLIPDFALPSVRAQFYRWGGCDISKGVSILGRLRLVGSGNIAPRLHIARGAIIAPGVTFGLDGEITIGANVSISPNATLYTATHSLGFGSRRMNLDVTPKPITVGEGVWIGMQALILPGVTLGPGSVISAGSIVAQDAAPNTLVGGNPAVLQHNLPFGDR